MTVATLVATSDCDGPAPSDTVRDVGRPPTGQTFVARARVKRERWDRFEETTEQQDTDRSKALNEFIAWYNREPGARLPRRPDRAAAPADESSAS